MLWECFLMALAARDADSSTARLIDLHNMSQIWERGDQWNTADLHQSFSTRVNPGGITAVAKWCKERLCVAQLISKDRNSNFDF